MGMVIGIDVGGSTTKIIGVDKEGIKHPMIVKAEDPITSLFGAFGKYIYDNGISLNDIDKVMLTGVGSAYVNQPLYGLSTDHTDEFLANGLGAHYDSQLQDLIVVSMGTGTSFVKVEGGKNISHIGGIGIGGGTIQGLSRLLLKTQNIHQVVKMAEKGVATNVHYKPLPMMTAYKNLGFDIKDYPNAYEMYHNEITLPLHTRLTDNDVAYVIENFVDIVKSH